MGMAELAQSAGSLGRRSLERRRRPPDDLTQALSAHLVASARRYGLDAGSLRLEPFYCSAVEATRSFTARDRVHAVHVKLWHIERHTVRDRWLAVHEILECRHKAPHVIDTVELSEVDATGLVFEHIEGAPPDGPGSTDRLLEAARLLHGDEELAAKIGVPRSPDTVGQYFEDLHIRNLQKDIGIIRDTARTPIVDDELLAWMEHETRELRRTAKNSAAFEVLARWPTHGDLYEGNTLLTDDGVFYVLDWDDLALGDPVADYIIVLRGPARRDPDFDWRCLGVEATDEGFGERMRFYARASLLYGVIDGLAEHLGLDASNPLLASTSSEKRAAFENGLVLYRERYG